MTAFLEGNSCVVGLQWGDEAKGKIVDLLGDGFDIVVRYNGGANAGHTVVIGDAQFWKLVPPTPRRRKTARQATRPSRARRKAPAGSSAAAR